MPLLLKTLSRKTPYLATLNAELLGVTRDATALQQQVREEVHRECYLVVKVMLSCSVRLSGCAERQHALPLVPSPHRPMPIPCRWPSPVQAAVSLLVAHCTVLWERCGSLAADVSAARGDQGVLQQELLAAKQQVRYHGRRPLDMALTCTRHHGANDPCT